MAGEGGFGSTFRATHSRCGSQGAVKLFHAMDRDECEHEVSIYTYIMEKDQALRRFLHIFESNVDAPMPYLALPWIPGGSLSHYLRQQRSGTVTGALGLLRPAKVLQAVAHQVADGLHFLHSVSVVHADVKPSNLMLDFECVRVVIVDFNAAERTNLPGWKPRHDDMLTSVPYRAPELCSFDHRACDHCTPAIDIWSYGVTCVETIRGGDSLFGSGGCNQTAAKRIVQFSKHPSAMERLITTFPRSVGPVHDIHAMVRSALAVDPAQRSLHLLSLID